MREVVETSQGRFHRYVAVLFAVLLPLFALIELSGMDRAGGAWVLSVAASLIISIWAGANLRRPSVNALPLVLATAGLVGSLTIVEVLTTSDRSSVDVVTPYGVLMVLAVLAGTLSAGGRLVWSTGFGITVSAWIVAIGAIQSEPFDRIAVRSLVAVVGIVFTTALVSKLFDQLAAAIERHEHASRLQSAIATCSEALLVHTDKFAIHEALKALLDAGDPDYAYVDKTIYNEDGTVGWEIVAEAHKSGLEIPSDWVRGEYDFTSEMYRRLATGRSIVVRTAELEGRLRDVYERDGIASEAIVPVFIGATFRGSIGFISYSEDREWTDDEMDTLWRASHMISAYWRRHDDKEELRASNESKDRLLASVSHEIRTPLTAIVGLSEEIVAHRLEMSESEIDELSGIIATQSQELADLVEDLLVGARADSGDLSIKSEAMDLRHEVDKVVRGVRETTPATKVIAVVGEDVEAWADPLRCRQVIRNLLTNAIKYGGDRVAVVVRRGVGSAQVLVIDDGVGVSADEAELIFERYYRSQASPTQPGSVGIGLAVSRQLAEMMGGTLSYDTSNSESRFVFSVPASAPVIESDHAVAKRMIAASS